MLTLSNQTKKVYEVMLENETREMSIRDRIKYFKEVSDYILNICPLGYRNKCEDCIEKCKTGEER